MENLKMKNTFHYINYRFSYSIKKKSRKEDEIRKKVI